MAKYGLILLASGLFIQYWAKGAATTVIFIMITAVIVISFIASYFRRKRVTAKT